MKKYDYYEASVQSSDLHLEWFQSWFSDIHHKAPVHLREDFCGTFKTACAWVKAHPEHTAVALDLDLEPLRVGEKKYLKRLSAQEKERIWVQQQDVLVPHPIQRDLIIAGNFSFYIFKTRATLVKYFRNCYQALLPQGLLVLEAAGGPGMIEPIKERRKVREGGLNFTYVWDQKSFNPINHHAVYSIHFKTPEGVWMKDAFTYDWRLWTLPEVQECIAEAGFEDCKIYWETVHKGEGTGEYVPMVDADNAYSWIAYIVGVKQKLGRSRSKSRM